MQKQMSNIEFASYKILKAKVKQMMHCHSQIKINSNDPSINQLRVQKVRESKEKTSHA